VGGRQTAFERRSAAIVGAVGVIGGNTDQARGANGACGSTGSAQVQSFIALQDGTLTGAGPW
jgi:hypothetical protein